MLNKINDPSLGTPYPIQQQMPIPNFMDFAESVIPPYGIKKYYTGIQYEQDHNQKYKMQNKWNLNRTDRSKTVIRRNLNWA